MCRKPRHLSQPRQHFAKAFTFIDELRRNKGLAAQIGHADGVMAGQRVRFSQRQHKRLAVYDHGGHALGVAAARAQQARINFTQLQRLQLARRCHGHHLHMHLFMAGPEPGQHLRQHARGNGRGDIAQLDMAAHALRGQLPDLLGALHMAQHDDGFFIQQLTRVGQRDGLALVAL